MIKKTIKYTDYNGTQREEDFYFNLTKTEIIELELSADGGLTNMIERIVKTQDAKQLVGYFKDLILKSYGEKSPDGRRFIKSKELSEAFSQTEAYNELFIELSTVSEAAVDFVNGIIPKGIDLADK